MKKASCLFKLANIFFFTIFIVSCSNNNKSDTQGLEHRISRLEKNQYSPGFGEFMITIELHHEKLWFAGIKQNWPLAAYEASEIKETFDALQQYVKNRPEVKEIPMIYPSLNKIEKAVRLKNTDSFKAAYITLTKTCNSCHEATNHAFNVITIPQGLPVTDQQFSPTTK